MYDPTMDAAAVGTIAVWGAVALCAIVVVIGFLGGPGAARRSSRGLIAAAALASTAVVTLAWALVSGDFSIAYVAETTTKATPWPYKLAATWGAMDGSLLFWTALIAVMGAIGVRSTLRRSPHLVPVAAATVAVGVAAFLVLGDLVASPFATLAIPAIDGGGLVPILQHPAMVYHPPILYVGLTSLVVPVALTTAALVTKRLDTDWVVLTRRWVLFSWTVLVLGMVLGANWAYVELGWGGFWAWDSVENTALMPWLAATAFLHSSRIQLRTGRLARWNASLATLPFGLVILGSYLTRSGVTESVHGFAESPVIGRTLLGFLIVASLAGVILLVVRSDRTGGWSLGSTRDKFLFLNALLLLLALVVVAIGSTYPAFSLWLTSGSVTVATRWYVTMLIPLAIVAVVAMAVALTTDKRSIRRSLAIFGTSSAAVFVVALGLGTPAGAPLVLLTFTGGAVVTLVVQLLGRPYAWRRLPPTIAHLGFVILLFGAAGSALGSDFSGGVREGDAFSVGGYTFTVGPIEAGAADRYDFIRATVFIDRNGSDVGNVVPELRAYEGSVLPTPEPALLSMPVDDIIVGISRVSDDASVVRITALVRPLVLWVWVGAGLVAVSGLVGLAAEAGLGASQRRKATKGQPVQGSTSDKSMGESPSQVPQGQMPDSR